MSGRGRAEVALRAGLLVLLGACTPEVAVPDDLSIRCDGRDECPAGYHCELSIGRCVLDGTDAAAPEVTALAVAPSLLRDGGLLVVTFDLNKALARLPDVRLRYAGGTTAEL